MSKEPITDAEAQQLLSGATPEGHPELSALAASIADVRRDAAQVPAPQPSFALAAQLAHPTPGASTPLRRERKRATPIARFGLAAKIAAAVGVLALGFLGVGAAGALPGAAQDAFDDVVSTIVSSEGDTTGDGVADDEGVGDGTAGGDGTADECVVDDGTTDEGATDEATEATEAGTETEACEPALPVGSGQFSEWVKQGARDPNKIGSEFGAAVAEQARELKNEKAEERAEEAGTDGTTNGNVGSTPGGNGNGSAGSNSGGNGNGNGTGNGNTGAATQDDDESSNGNGKPADPPAGRP